VNYRISFIQVVNSFFIILIFFQLSCSNNQPIEKLNVQTETNKQNAFMKYDCIESPDQNHDYLHLKTNGTTYRALYLTINGEKIIKTGFKIKR